MEDNNIIEVKDLVKKFKGNTALDGISFIVPSGSICGFLGPNGAGKTTTIKILLGLIGKDSGEARLFGKEVSMNKGTALKRRIGYLPQDPVFPKGLTGWEILRFTADIYSLKGEGSDKEIDELLEQFDLISAGARRVENYSRGMKQRLGIAAVLLPKPELMLLDEPVSALDPEGRHEMLSTLLQLKGRSTIFFSSHILADVERVCDRVVMIDKGRKLMESGISDLLDRYSTEKYLLKVADLSCEGRREHSAPDGQPEDDTINRALKLIREEPCIKETVREGDSILISARHGMLDELRDTVIPLMVREKMRITEFSLVKRNLEEIFLDITGTGREGGNCE